MRTIFRTGSQRRPPLSKAARLSQNQNGGHHQNASARRPSASRPRSAATAAQSREWTSPPRPRQSRSDVGVEPGEVHGYRRDLGVTATPTARYRRGRRLQAGDGRPPACAPLGDSRVSARRDQGGHGPVARAVVSTCMRPRASLPPLPTILCRPVAVAAKGRRFQGSCREGSLPAPHPEPDW
jgi:hypothetical protein